MKASALDALIIREFRSGNDPDMEDFVAEDEQEAAELLQVPHEALKCVLLVKLRYNQIDDDDEDEDDEDQ